MSEPAPWSSLAKLKPHKIAALRVMSLTSQERARLLARFMGHRGQDRMPSAPIISELDQRHLQTLYKIDVERLKSLLVLISRTDIAALLRIPVTAQDKDAFTNVDREIAEQIVRYELVDDAARQAVGERLTEIYQYLRGTAAADRLRLFQDTDSVDLVIVPGCRGNGMRLRVRRALDVLGNSATPGRLFLSGWHPYYARQFDFDSAVDANGHELPLPFGEADAMAAVVDELEPERLRAPYRPPGRTNSTDAPLRQVLVDSRARNTLETVVHCLPVIHETFAVLGRPLRICLVTSPYHVRRFHAIATVQLGRLLPFSETVESVTCAPARSGLDRQQLATLEDPRHTDAVALYVRECLKLLGGRATGEF